VHDVYFADNGHVEGHTAEARSPRMESVDALRNWLREQLQQDVPTIVCGDLGYAHNREDVALWPEHINDVPVDVR
jgi:exonuclease III